MLPSFPKIENLQSEQVARQIEERAAVHAPMLADINKHIQFEGKHSTIFRSDGSVGNTSMKPISAEVEMKKIDLFEFISSERFKKIDELAIQLAGGISENLFASIGESTSATGNVVDAKGQRLNEDLLLEAIEKMEHSFEPDGTWNPPTIVASPETVGRLVKSYKEEGEKLSIFNEKLGKILEKKRDDFRRREADRILVG